MGALIQIITMVLGLVSLACFIMVVVKMFQNGQTGVGIACIVLVLCFGIGGLIAFIYGWIKAKEWNIQNLMAVWTVCFLINLVLTGYGLMSGLTPLPAPAG